jgi:hypothetical protein
VYMAYCGYYKNSVNFVLSECWLIQKERTFSEARKPFLRKNGHFLSEKSILSVFFSQNAVKSERKCK